MFPTENRGPRAGLRNSKIMEDPAPSPWSWEICGAPLTHPQDADVIPSAARNLALAVGLCPWPFKLAFATHRVKRGEAQDHYREG